MKTETTVKTCPECGHPFAIQKFGGGRQKFCSSNCRITSWKKFQASRDPDAVKAERRAIHEKHRDKRLLRMIEYNAKHAEERRERAKRYYAEHRDEIREKNRQYHEANRDSQNVKIRLQNQKARINHPWRELLHAAKSRARLKNLPHTLTKEWAAARWTGRCEVTGLEFKLGLIGTGPQMWSPSIDRIKPHLGYTQENCRFVLVAVNIFKMTGTDAEMLLIAKAIVRGLS